jgi:hypothetical protein
MLHVDLPSRARIERLASAQGEACVSIYLRTTPLTQDAQDDRIALKNLLKEAVTQLEARGVAKRAIWPIEEMVGALVDDDEFWATQANSLAIFATPERISTMRLANRIENSATAADRFFIKPLIRAVTFPQEAFVLAISTGAVRLIEVSADLPVHEVAVPGLPSGIEEALGRRKIVRKSGMVGGHAGSESAQIAAYGRIVDHALKPALAGQERPLIIAAAEPMASAFRSVATYPHVADEVIQGTADRTPDGELASAARVVLDGIHAGEIARLKELYAARGAQGRATTDLAQAARAATFGAVDTLIVDMDVHVRGTIGAEDGALAFADADDSTAPGVTDEIVRRALLSGARIVSARHGDVPEGAALAAILRYPV